MIGFGLMDQTVMLQAGNAIDCTLGVTFGLSTLTAAAFGQICSDASGVLFGGTLERLAKAAGLPSANLSAAQRVLPVIQRARLAGSFFGIIFGCSLGLINLLFIDTSRSSTLKLQTAFGDEQEFEFTIEASNAIREDATCLTVRGPDVDGMLASMTAALAVNGCSLVELHAKRKVDETSVDDKAGIENPVGDIVVDPSEATVDVSKAPTAASRKEIEDTFFVVSRETGEPFEDDDLEELARALLDSTRKPINVNTVQAQISSLELTNEALQERVQTLEEIMYRKQISIVKRESSSSLSATSTSAHAGSSGISRWWS